jgi:predicted permease
VVTPEFFDVLGVPALLGRTLTAEDASNNPGALPAVLSCGFWRRRFDGDPRTIGKTVTLNGKKFLIVGVMPRDFNGISMDTSADVRVPLRAFPLIADLDSYPKNLDWRDDLSMDLSARLKPGVTRGQAGAECLAIFRSLADQLPEFVRPDIERGLELDPLDRGISILRDRFAGALKLMIASAGLLLLMVCANVSGLLLARSASRRGEIAVRLAVGATRARLIRQMLTESALLAAIGAAGGIALAFLMTPVLVRSLPSIRDAYTSRVPISIDIRPDLRVLFFTLAVSVVTVLLFGLAPAVAAARASLDGVLRGARSSGAWRGRQILIVLQVALCTMLLAGAGLLVRTFQQLRGVDPGFDRDHIVTFTANLQLANYTADQAKAFRIALTERVRALPGVADVAFASRALMRGSGVKTTVAPIGERAATADFMNTSLNDVTSEYFDTMGMRIVAGRNFMDSDQSAEPRRVLVNEAFARRFFADTDPIGKLFGIAYNAPARGDSEIIGVVTDAKYRSLREPMTSTIYNFWEDARNSQFHLCVHTRMNPASVIQPVRQILAQLDPALPFTEVETLSDEVEASTAAERLTASLASIFGALAAALAAIGIYGLLAYVVAQRRREIGIRMALGARPADIAEMIGLQALWMVAIGIAAGLAAAMLTAPLVNALLYGVAPLDPASFAYAAMFVLLVAAAATAFPAMRATRIAPASALRQEN